MGDIAAPLTIATPGAQVSYAVWCQCTRLLLGWADGEGEIPPDLYAAHLTPLAAVRQMLLGTPAPVTLH